MNPTIVPPPDTSTIDLDDESSVNAWAGRLGVSAAEIRDAVRAVGAYAKDVEAFIRGGGTRVP